jgi:membrane-associated phospholipid phosphatase
MTMSVKLAKLISNILNPFLVSIIVLIMLAFKTSDSIGDAVKWALISLALSVLPIFIVIISMVRLKKLDGLFVNPRKQRNGIYLLASVLGALGSGLLWYLKAPHILFVTFTAGLIAMVVFMVINYFWKISVHTAFIAASVAELIMVFGVAAVWAVILIPPVAWARIKLQQHSIAQVVTGGLLASVIVIGVFWGFGVMG